MAQLHMDGFIAVRNTRGTAFNTTEAIPVRQALREIGATNCPDCVEYLGDVRESDWIRVCDRHTHRMLEGLCHFI